MPDMEKEDQLLRRRFIDQAEAAEIRGNVIFSDFMNLNEQGIFSSIKHELPVIKYFTYGGYSEAERKILCFCGDDTVEGTEDITYPISCVRLSPHSMKFSDSFSHRDFLGAVINLGIERSKIGDILVIDNMGYLFCTASIAGFIADQLTKVKHTLVSAEVIEQNNFTYKPKFKEITGSVSSIRLDSILAVAIHSSRSSLTGLIEGGKVYVNSRPVISNSYSLKENDIVSVRGFGKFIYAGVNGQSKKERYSVKILLYSE